MTDRLDTATLTRMGTDYLARFAAPTQRLRLVLERRVRRWYGKRDLPIPDDVASMIEDVVVKLVRLGLVDDRAFAVGKARSLVRKGLPAGRVRMALSAAGVDHRTAEIGDVLQDDDVVQAERYTARKRLGPHRRGDRAPWRDKDIRSLMRAGFSFRAAAAAIDADPERDS